MNFKVVYQGLCEGYEIVRTWDPADDFEVFTSYRDAKADAVEKAKNDIELARIAFRSTKAIRKSQCIKEY